MSDTVIKVENLSKLYRLGEVGTGTLSHDLNRWWARIRGKEDPFTKVGQVNDRTQAAGKGEHVWALKDINFEVKQGEVLGIIGKNGAGKSTLLKILSRITSPTSGNIKLKGRVASLLEVGTGMHPEMTGRENVYLNGTILGMSRKEIDNKFEEIMNFAGCLKYADTPVKRYSSGMKVRLGFAVAAFLEPEILIVDEVLAVGDAEFQKRAIGKMRDVSQGEGRTVLFVSHNMVSVQGLCNKCILLENGFVKLNGDVEEVIYNYLNSNRITNSNLGNDRFLNKNGKLAFVGAEIKNNPANKIRCGEDLIIKVKLKSNKKLSGKVDLAIKVVSYNNLVIFSCATKYTNQGFVIENENEITVICTVPQCNIYPGVYRVTGFAQFFNEAHDYVEQLMEFEVVENDVFGTGKSSKKDKGILIFNQDWHKLDG